MVVNCLLLLLLCSWSATSITTNALFLCACDGDEDALCRLLSTFTVLLPLVSHFNKERSFPRPCCCCWYCCNGIAVGGVWQWRRSSLSAATHTLCSSSAGTTLQRGMILPSTSAVAVDIFVEVFQLEVMLLCSRSCSFCCRWIVVFNMAMIIVFHETDLCM
jgi:hypothetical protein